MSGIGMNTHNATITNGQYDSAIGETTLKAFCNDSEGFAIYAIGYTDNIDGKNVLTDATLGSTHDIVTGTAISGATSNWAMKLTAVTNPTPTYPITIQNSFDSFHNVPTEQTLVAKRTSATDIGASAEGSSLKTTYQTYISPTQIAGTYTGQVKYTLVHPNYVNKSAIDEAITVVFDGNGLTFPDGSTTNTVKYAKVCKPGEYAYVGNNYEEVMTSNITTGGTQNGPYTDSEYILQTITVPNADKLKVVVDYSITGNTTEFIAINGSWDGDCNNWIYNSNNISGSKSYIIEGNTTTIYTNSWGTPEDGHDKGFYVKIYPVYNTEQANTTYEQLPTTDCSVRSIIGTYMETSDWHHKWTATIDGKTTEFVDRESSCNKVECWDTETAEQQLSQFLLSDYDYFKGSFIMLYAFDPVTFDETYIAANKTKLNGYYKIQDLDYSMCSEVTENETTTVIDVRDNNTYNIIKASDGNCWLRNNLKLDPTNANTASNMSSANTNASNDAIYNFLHGGNPDSISGWTNTAISSPNDWPNSVYEKPYIKASNYEDYGIYYNYCAATAGTYCYSGSDSQPETALSDICPANWGLPTLQQLKNVEQQSLAPTVAGYYDSGTVLDEEDYLSVVGIQGYYWSSIRASSFMSKAVHCSASIYDDHCSDTYPSSPGNGQPRSEGLSIRCVIKPPK